MSVTMRYGKNKTGNELLSDNFAQVRGDTNSEAGWSDLYDYPDGYNADNCSIISLELYNDEYGWRSGTGAFSGTLGRVFAELNTDGVRVYRNEANSGDKQFRVTLMKTR